MCSMLDGGLGRDARDHGDDDPRQRVVEDGGGEDELAEVAADHADLHQHHGHDLDRGDRQRRAEEQRRHQPRGVRRDEAGRQGIGQRDAAGEGDGDAEQRGRHHGPAAAVDQREIGFHAGQQQQQQDADLRDRIDHVLERLGVSGKTRSRHSGSSGAEYRRSEQHAGQQLAEDRGLADARSCPRRAHGRRTAAGSARPQRSLSNDQPPRHRSPAEGGTTPEGCGRSGAVRRGDYARGTNGTSMDSGPPPLETRRRIAECPVEECVAHGQGDDGGAGAARRPGQGAGRVPRGRGGSRPAGRRRRPQDQAARRSGAPNRGRRCAPGGACEGRAAGRTALAGRRRGGRRPSPPATCRRSS